MEKWKLIPLIMLLVLASDRARAQTPAERVLREIPGEFRAEGNPREHTTVTILELTELGIASPYYEIRGQVEHEGVEGTAILEMWSHFPGGGRYFTRTLDTSGPMRGLRGTSGPRPFILPFQNNSDAHPIGLTVNILLPDKGTVKVSGLKLVQLSKPEAAGAWWEVRRAGWMGAIVGTGLGLVGGLVGILCASQRTRRAAQVLAIVTAGLCLVLLVAGIAALSMGQPYHIWYPLTLPGLLGMLVLGAVGWTIRRHLAEDELRRISALDAPG